MTGRIELGFDDEDRVPFDDPYDDEDDDEGAFSPDDFDLLDEVESEDACPACGERDVDWLEIDEDSCLCLRCGCKWSVAV